MATLRSPGQGLLSLLLLVGFLLCFFLPSPLLPVPQLRIAPLRDGQLPVAVSLQHPLGAGGGDPVVWEGKRFWVEECRRATQQSRPAESLRAVN